MKRRRRPARRRGGAVRTVVVQRVTVEKLVVDQLTRRVRARLRELGMTAQDAAARLDLSSARFCALVNQERLQWPFFERLDALLGHPDWTAQLPRFTAAQLLQEKTDCSSFFEPASESRATTEPVTGSDDDDEGR